MVTNWKLECGRQLQSRPLLGKNSEVSANDTATREGRALTPTRSKIVSETDPPELLQLRVLRLGFLQHGDVGIGVFPEGEEVLVRSVGFCGISLHRICTRKAHARQRTQREVSHRAPVIDKFLIFHRRLFASMQPQIGFASYIGGMEGGSPFCREYDGAELV